MLFSDKQYVKRRSSRRGKIFRWQQAAIQKLDKTSQNIYYKYKNNSKKIKILFLSAEVAPLAKVGGLGDIAGTLPIALAKLGVDIRIYLPFYGLIDNKKYPAKKIINNDPVINLSSLFFLKCANTCKIANKINKDIM